MTLRDFIEAQGESDDPTATLRAWGMLIAEAKAEYRKEILRLRFDEEIPLVEIARGTGIPYSLAYSHSRTTAEKAATERQHRSRIGLAGMKH